MMTKGNQPEGQSTEEMTLSREEVKPKNASIQQQYTADGGRPSNEASGSYSGDEQYPQFSHALNKILMHNSTYSSIYAHSASESFSCRDVFTLDNPTSTPSGCGNCSDWISDTSDATSVKLAVPVVPH